MRWVLWVLVRFPRFPVSQHTISKSVFYRITSRGVQTLFMVFASQALVASGGFPPAALEDNFAFA